MLSTTGVVVGTLGLGALGAAAVARTSYKKRLANNKSLTAQQFHEKQSDQIRALLQSESDLRALPLRLFQYTTCPYCSKLKCFLDHHKVAYECVEVNPMNKKQLAHSEYKKIPQLQLGTDGPFLVDSVEIVDKLKPLVDPQAPTRTKEEKQWSEWSKHLLGMLVLNTNRNMTEARDNFSYVKNAPFSAWEKFLLQNLLPAAMYGITQKAIKPRMIKEGIYNTELSERDGLYQVVNHWLDDGVGSQPMHGGSSPSTADLEIYGILRTQQPFPVFEDIQKNVKQPQFDNWFRAVKEAIPPPQSPKE